MTADEAQRQPAGPLDGLVVCDLTRVLAGPLATMYLGDLGAIVIKVERPGDGDDVRHWGPSFAEAESSYFWSVNRNKRSIELDFNIAEDRRRVTQLAARSDVVIENFRPGRLGSFELDYDSVRATNPGVIYCSISGFGTTEGADLAGYDFIAQAVGGLMSITGGEKGPPQKVGVPIVDVLTGLNAVVGILAALRERDITGHGQRVEVNLLSSLLSALVNQASTYLNDGTVPGRMGNEHPSIAPYETLRTLGGEPIAVAIGNDRQFVILCSALSIEKTATEERFATNAARVMHRGALVTELESVLATRPAKEWIGVLRQAGIAAGPVNDLKAAFEDANRLQRNPVITQRDGTREIRTVANPIALSSTPTTYRRSPPRLGADTDEVIAWLDSAAGVALDPPPS